MGIGQEFSTRLINELGSGPDIFNPFNFDMNTNRHDLTYYSTLNRFTCI